MSSCGCRWKNRCVIIPLAREGRGLCLSSLGCLVLFAGEVYVRDYELVTVVSPEAGDEGFPGTIERVHRFIQDRGGAITKDDRWGRRRLAYPIRRQTEAFYSVTHFSLDPQSVRALEGSLDLAEDVLRHLVVRMEEVATAGPASVTAPATEENALVSATEPDVEDVLEEAVVEGTEE